MQPGLSCMKCAACLGGHDNLCRCYRILGENAQGGYAEYIVVPEVEPRAVSRAARLRARGGAAPDDAHGVADGRAQGARAARRDGARAGRRARAWAWRRSRSRKLYGARVIATAGSDDKVARAKALGADDGRELHDAATSSPRPRS